MQAPFLSRWPTEMPSAQQVDVKVEYRLSGSRTDVQDGAVSVLDVALARNFGSGEMAAAYRFGIFRLRFLQSRKMFFGNDEHVRRGFRVDVFKGEDMLVFVDFLRWYLALNDTAEKAVAGGVGH